MRAGLDPFSFLVVSVAGWMNERQGRVIEYLVEENRVLREQMGHRRLRFSDSQRRRLTANTRRIIGFGIQAGIVDGLALCRMFNQAIRGQRVPKYLSSDHDPLYRFHQWQANLRVLGVTEIKTVPYVPLSHPFVERLIGTIRRECLDQLLFWTTANLEAKLLAVWS